MVRAAAPLWSPVSGKRAFDVLGLGESSIDHLCLVGDSSSPGRDQRLEGYSEQPGGQVATAMLGCARLGLRAAFAGNVGDDAAARVVLAPLDEAGVEISGVHRIEGAPTRTAVVLVDRESGERTLFWYRDPRLALNPAQLARREILNARVLLIDAEDPDAAAWAARVARDAGIAVVLDADRHWPEATALLKLVDFPIVACSFAEALGQTGRADDGLRALVTHGAKLAVVTLGAGGASARTDSQAFESAAYHVQARDTTGAGDAFHAGFIWGLLQGQGAEACLRSANAAAAINCQALGAQGRLPTESELLEFMQTHTPDGGTGRLMRGGEPSR